MIFKVGDVYRNKETNIPCFIKGMKGMDYVITWSFKSVRSVNHWQRPIQEWEQAIEGPDGYIEYSCLKSHDDLLQEISRGYLNSEYKLQSEIVIRYIPQHSFLAHQ